MISTSSSRAITLAMCAMALTACTSVIGKHDKARDVVPAPSSGPATVSVLDRALAKVSDTSVTRGSVEFARPTALRQANAGQLSGLPYGGGFDIALDDLADVDAQADAALGFDPAAADEALEVGVGPTQAGLFDGLKTTAVSAHLRNLGATREGGVLRLSRDGTVGEDARLTRALPGLFYFDVARVSATAVRYAGSTAALNTFEHADTTLADDPVLRTAASCLANPLAAVLSDGVPADPADHRRTHDLDVVEAGAGLSGAKGAAPVETFCVVGASVSAAVRVERAERAGLHSSQPVFLGRTWGQLLKDPVISRHRATVRLEAQTSADPIVLVEGMRTGQLPGFTG